MLTDNRKVAWCKSGAIASITPDGESVELRFLRAHPETGVWDLSEATTCDLVKGTASIPLVHLEWGTTSISELAVFDSVGRVTLMSFSLTVNHAISTRKWDGDAVDDINAIVGCHWLNVAPVNPQKPYNVLYGPAKKHGNSFQYESTFVPTGGPHHPHVGKSALFCVTMNGTLKMYWTQNNNRTEESTVDLESISASDGVVTHAALASDKKHLSIAMVTSTKKLRLVRLEIQWAGPGAVQEKTTISQTSRLNPALVESHAATVDLRADQTAEEITTGDLTQLHALPSVSDPTGSQSSPLVVVALRMSNPDAFPETQPQTVIDRWEAVEERQSINSSLEQLGFKRDGSESTLPMTTRLRKLDPIIINKVVVGLTTTRLGKVVVLAMADGTVEHRDRTTFDELYTDGETEALVDLRQVGWTFTDEGSCHQVAFSPTCSSKVQLGEDSKVRWSRLHYVGDMGETMQDVVYSQSITAATISTASSVWYQANFDDLVAVMSPLTEKKSFARDWATELVRILKLQVDYVDETQHDALMRNAQLQACFSIMSSLGFKGEFTPRTFQSKFANVNLNIRNVVILISLASNTPVSVKEKMSPLDEPEVVNALAGCAQWSLDLLSWIAGSLFELMDDKKFTEMLTPQRFQEVAAYLQEKNDISLHLVLSSCSRSFLGAICRRVMHLKALSERAIDFWKQPGQGKRPVSAELEQAYHRMQKVTSAALIHIPEFEKLLAALGQDIRTMYTSFLPNLVKNSTPPPKGKNLENAMKVARMQLEMYLLLTKSPAPAFVAVIAKFFAKDLSAFRARTDPARLFFYDFSLLSEDDAPKTLAGKKQRKVWVDMFKKSELRFGATQQPWRRCVRCAAVMEDAVGERPGYRFVLGQQRKCACGGNWSFLAPNKLIP